MGSDWVLEVLQNLQHGVEIRLLEYLLNDKGEIIPLIFITEI